MIVRMIMFTENNMVKGSILLLHISPSHHFGENQWKHRATRQIQQIAAWRKYPKGQTKYTFVRLWVIFLSGETISTLFLIAATDKRQLSDRQLIKFVWPLLIIHAVRLSHSQKTRWVLLFRFRGGRRRPEVFSLPLCSLCHKICYRWRAR